MHPAGFFNVKVDIAAARVELAQVRFGSGSGLIGLTQGGDLLAQAIQFCLGGKGG
jgi:hypothetical protein